VYSEEIIRENGAKILKFPRHFDFQARFAMKALPTKAILHIVHDLGFHIDASSGYEVERALLSGIPPHHISLSTQVKKNLFSCSYSNYHQELPLNFGEYHEKGVEINLCSLDQIARFGEKFPNSEVFSHSALSFCLDVCFLLLFCLSDWGEVQPRSWVWIIP